MNHPYLRFDLIESHVRPEYVERYTKRKLIELSEYANMCMNSYERSYLLPIMSDDVLASLIGRASDFSGVEAKACPTTYTEAAAILYAPEALKRLQATYVEKKQLKAVTHHRDELLRLARRDSELANAAVRRGRDTKPQFGVAIVPDAIRELEEQRDTAKGESILNRNALKLSIQDHREALSEISQLKAELDAAKAEAKRYGERLQIDPGGSDRIDELEAALDHLKDGNPATKSKDERAWLIERVNAPTAWLGVPIGCHGKPTWTVANYAIRFARKEDADRCAIALGLKPDEFVVTEHVWCDSEKKEAGRG